MPKDKDNSINWQDSYRQLVDRNIGLISKEQQEKLRNSCVSVFGLGGLGGVIAELLTRLGVGQLKIVDNDRFEPTNLNRQIFSFLSTVGQLKVDVTEKFLKDINPQINIDKYSQWDEEKAKQILKGSDVAILAIDKVKPCIIISRASRKLNIPLIEGWAIPFGNVRVYSRTTPTLEEVYHLPTIGKQVSQISDEEADKLTLQMVFTLANIEGIENFYPSELVKRIKGGGKFSTLGPIVWLVAVIMCLEAMKILLNWGKISWAPKLSTYDPFYHRIPKIKDVEGK